MGVKASLQRAWEIGLWTDVVLVGGDHTEVAAHRLVLAANSPMLGKLLAERGEGEAKLLLPDVPGWALQLLVGTLYGDTAIDTAAPGSELLVDAACLLGLGPERFPTSVISLPDLCSLGGSRNDDILHEIERLSKDLFSQMESNPNEVLKEATNKNEVGGLLANNNDNQTSVIQALNQNEQAEQMETENEPTTNDKLLSLLSTNNKEPLNLLGSDSEEPLSLLDCLSSPLPQTPVDQPQPQGLEAEVQDKIVDKAIRAESERPKSLSLQILACDAISMPRRQLLLSLLTCNSCNVVCKGLQERMEHVSCSPLTCVFSTCADVLSDWDQLMQHLTKMHRFNASSLARKAFRWMGRKSTSGRRGPSLLSCNICGEECSDPSALSRHMGNHGGKDRSSCEICSKEFRNKVSLRTHMKLVHKLGRQYTCAYCGKILYSSQYLMKHETTHTGERFKAAKCRFCGKTVEYCKLKNHELIHTGEKPFKCPDCDYRCIQRSNLRIHMRGVHKKELPRLAVGQKRYAGHFMDGTAGNIDPYDLRSVIHQRPGGET